MDEFECDLCGACCRTWRIFASDADAAREPRIASEARKLPEGQATEHWTYQLFKLPFHEGCVFLGEGNRCSIYETRPRVCREFTAGSERCQDARAMSSLPPLPRRVVPVTINGQRK